MILQLFIWATIALILGIIAIVIMFNLYNPH